MRDDADVRRPSPPRSNLRRQRKSIVNQIVWLVGAVVIVLFVLSYFGLRCASAQSPFDSVVYSNWTKLVGYQPFPALNT